MPADVTAAHDALHARLVAVASEVCDRDVDAASVPTMELLATLATAVRDEGASSRLWLLICAVAGVMPRREDYLRALRALELAEPGVEHLAMLEACAGLASENDRFADELIIVTGETVVDVDFTARHGHNTGIQRVVRETMARWDSNYAVTFVAWAEDGATMRTLVPHELALVTDWHSGRILERSHSSSEDSARRLIPWRSTVVLPEVAQLRVWERLSTLAEFSGNRVVAVGYDAIPVSSAEYVIPSEVDRFVRYLSVVKHADLVVGISESSTEEFAGFSAALSAQGLAGPASTTVSLPVDLPARRVAEQEVEARAASDPPLVICVGTLEPRKNQLAVLAAAEQLWKRGLEFELQFIGAPAMPLAIPFNIEAERLRRLGRTVTIRRRLSDTDLARAYRDARFSVFVSLHEGYGLPVAESLAAGTPVITTNYGSMAEIASDGGCLTVDPRDDEAITAGIERLLTDDALLSELRAEVASRTMKTWDEYAAALWDAATAMTSHD